MKHKRELWWTGWQATQDNGWMDRYKSNDNGNSNSKKKKKKKKRIKHKQERVVCVVEEWLCVVLSQMLRWLVMRFGSGVGQGGVASNTSQCMQPSEFE